MADDPAAVFKGTLLILAPHMDDEALACGGTMALLPDPGSIHVVYATDGSRSPARPLARCNDGEELREVRRQEARTAMQILGLPDENLHFLDFPDGRLRRHSDRLSAALRDILLAVDPDNCLLPFRYDRHVDHLTLRRAVIKAISQIERRPLVTEYFVYYRWRLIPGGDVRRYVRPDRLVEVDIGAVAERKLKALRCYVSQTTRYCSWQRRPILPESRLITVSSTPELFLRCEAGEGRARVLTRYRLWIPFVHRVEPALKQIKETVRHLASSVRGTHDE
jgi:LmbE family N-acetylglucosaminyl deacetylase